MKENSFRIDDGEGDHHDILTLIELFTTSQNFPEKELKEVAAYLNCLHLLVDELYETLQNMTFGEVDLPHIPLLHSSSSRFKEVSYDLGKVFEYLNKRFNGFKINLITAAV
ncbi:hypothetical protein MKX42_30305 [Paenibacillus sp. FSL R7-0204]|uniref:hypothetical protein n=1 Tax=Paenibacillus sp. FSL R7-0204 TaxID=2921675 RepID=UPI0030F97C34